MAKILTLEWCRIPQFWGTFCVVGRSSTTSNFMFITAQDFHPEELTGLCAKYINGKLIVTKSDEQVNKIVKKYKKELKKIQSIKKIQNNK